MTNIKKHSKRISGIAAVAAVSVLLIGGTVSAAMIYNKDVHFSTKGLTASEDVQISYTDEEGEEAHIKLPEMAGDDIITPISEEEGSLSDPWLSRKVWDETYEIWDSDDGVNWTRGYQTTRTTEYKYEDYFTAAGDAGFDKIFDTNYTGDISYYQHEYLPDESDEAAGLGSTTSCGITGEFSYGNGRFTVDQSKNPADESGEVSSSASIVITTAGGTSNEREYLNAAGISFKLSDDTEFGTVRTTTMLTGNNYETILQFTGMSEEEIHQVLDGIRG